MPQSVETSLASIWNAFSNMIDDESKGHVTIDLAHHMAHDGNHFFVSGYSDLDDGESISFAVTAPNTSVEIHMQWDVSATAAFTVTMYENALVTGGTPVIPFNSNRRVENVSDAILAMNPTATSVGFALAQSKFGAAVTNKFSPTGGTDRRESEIILKKNTTYLWVITSATDDNIVDYHGQWYELTH